MPNNTTYEYMSVSALAHSHSQLLMLIAELKQERQSKRQQSEIETAFHALDADSDGKYVSRAVCLVVRYTVVVRARVLQADAEGDG